MNDQSIPELDPHYWNVNVTLHPLGSLAPSPNTPAWPAPGDLLPLGDAIVPRGDWTRTPEGFPLWLANIMSYLTAVQDCLVCELAHQSSLR
jgi:hypothetical protein